MLIGLAANAMGAGKSTVASHLIRQHRFVHVAFADTLKEMFSIVLRDLGYSDHITRRMLYVDLKEEPIPALNGVTTRHCLQTIGTEWGRQWIDSDIWVKIAIAKANRARDAGHPVVIDDMRFPNELAAVRASDGCAVFVERPGVVVTSGHLSEGQIKRGDCDYCIFNGGDIPRLQMETNRMLLNLPHLRLPAAA